MPSPVELVLSIARSLVGKPDKVTARWVDNPEGGMVELDVAPEDRGKIIGKRGRTIESLRTLANAAFGAEGKKVDVELIEEEEGPRSEPR